MTPRPDIPNSILAGYRGSHAHGTYIDPEADPQFGTDDIDLMHVVVLPPEYYVGLDTMGYGKGTKEVKDGPWDIVSYDIRKFVTLLAKGNPNVLMMLWLRQEHYLSAACTNAGQLLRLRRERLTLTKATISSHVGYAQGQLNAMRKDPTNAAYMGERRRALAVEFGYDVKHASHLIRLLSMLVELLKTGRLEVYRANAAELIEIKRGEWSLPAVLGYSEELLAEARELEATCGWPERIDWQEASYLAARCVRVEWAARGWAFGLKLGNPDQEIA